MTSYVWYKEDAAQAPGAGSKKRQVEEYNYVKHLKWSADIYVQLLPSQSDIIMMHLSHLQVFTCIMNNQ